MTVAYVVAGIFLWLVCIYVAALLVARSGAGETWHTCGWCRVPPRRGPSSPSEE